MLTLVFFASLLLIFWAYFGYPFSLKFLSLFRFHPVARSHFLPTLTLIITVHNEQKRIRDKIRNTLSLDYPRDSLQVLIASDGSTDSTNKIVAEYSSQGVELFHVERRGGKENAQKEAVSVARGDIIVFSDVSTSIEPDGLKKMMVNFADPSVGCVSSVDQIVGPEGKPGGEGFYVRYEMWLRGLESNVNSLVGLSGSFFAARREVCADFSSEMQSDFRTLLNSVKLGLRGISDPSVVGNYPDIADSKKEFNRKVRTVLRGMAVFFQNLEFLNPFIYGVFSYQYFCHKLLRWLVPPFMLVAFVANAFLGQGSAFYSYVFIAHCCFYVIALWSLVQKKPPAHPLLKIPMYFVMVNSAIAIAWLRYFIGHRMVMWAPTER